MHTSTDCNDTRQQHDTSQQLVTMFCFQSNLFIAVFCAKFMAMLIAINIAMSVAMFIAVLLCLMPLQHCKKAVIAIVIKLSE